MRMYATSTRHRYRMEVEFDGTNFSGWQKQKDARTVQGDLLKCVSRLLEDESVDIQGSGRTDKGVHGLAYTAHLDAAAEIDTVSFLPLFNEELPKDLAVLAMNEVDVRFHARHSCVARSYLYLLHTRKSAFGKRFGWLVRDALDLELMRQAAATLSGMHDFAAFAEKPELKKSTRVLMHGVQLQESDGVIIIRVIASHFLWHMVRRIVALLVDLGTRKLALEDVLRLMEEGSNSPYQNTAPAPGLYFEKACYDDGELAELLRGNAEKRTHVLPF